MWACRNTFRSAGFYTLWCSNSVVTFSFWNGFRLRRPPFHIHTFRLTAVHILSPSRSSILLFYFTYSSLSFPHPVLQGTHFFLVFLVSLFLVFPTSLFLSLLYFLLFSLLIRLIFFLHYFLLATSFPSIAPRFLYFITPHPLSSLLQQYSTHLRHQILTAYFQFPIVYKQRMWKSSNI